MQKRKTTLHAQAQAYEIIKDIESAYYEQAIRKATKITRIYPIIPFGWKLLGVAYQYNGQFKKALNAHLKAIKLNDEDPELYSNLGNCQSEMGFLNEAEDSYKKSIKINPRYAQGYSNLGSVQHKMGKLTEAIHSYKIAISLDPDFVIYQYNLSLVYSELDNLKEAEQLLRTVISKTNNFSNAYCKLALVLKKCGNLTEAIELSNISMQLDSENYEANYVNALILFECGMFVECAEMLKRANNIRSTIHAEVAINYLEANINKLHKSHHIDNSNENVYFVSRRSVEQELLDTLYKIDSMSFSETSDARYGNGRCSNGFKLFDDAHKIIKKLRGELSEIAAKLLNKKIHIVDSFLNIANEGSGTIPHHHLKPIDQDFNLWRNKYSLVYYVSVGDQSGISPGILNLYDPSIDILPENGMIVVIPAARKHSAVYSGCSDRILIGVNFYCTD